MMYHNMNTIDYLTTELELQWWNIKHNLGLFTAKFETAEPLVYHWPVSPDWFYEILKKENNEIGASWWSEKTILKPSNEIFNFSTNEVWVWKTDYS